MKGSEVWFMEVMNRSNNKSTVLLAEKFTAVHIVNVTKFGKLVYIKNINVVPSNIENKIILTVAAMKEKGKYLIAGHKWIRSLELTAN